MNKKRRSASGAYQELGQMLLRLSNLKQSSQYYSFCGLLHGLNCIESDVENTSHDDLDDTNLFFSVEELGI